MQQNEACYIATVGQLYHLTGRQIADQLKEFRNGNTAESEYRSWCHSIPALTAVLHKAGLDALTLALEYETPIGDRIDAVLLGTRRKDHHDLALIIELKQWSYIGPNDSQSESMVSVCVSEGERRFENRLHPVQQTLTYSKHLNENHSNVVSGKIAILRCQYLHNFERKQQLFEGLYRKYEKYSHETYIKGEEEKLAEFLKNTFFPESNQDAVKLFLQGEYRFGEIGFRGLKKALSSEENAVMIGDQIEINLKIWRKLKGLKDDPTEKELIILSGAPGTGKTILGLHIVYMYYNNWKGVVDKDGKCVFSLPRSRTLAQVMEGESGISPVYLDRVQMNRDVVVVDEAHRIENLDSTMDQLFSKTKMVIVLQDDKQRIRLSEEGTRENFIKYAEKKRIAVSEFCLSSQKRAGYMGNYLERIDALLYNNINKPIAQKNGISVVCWDSLLCLDKHLQQLHKEGSRVKWFAPYCWSWTKSVRNDDILIQSGEEIWKKAWNPMQEQYQWYQSETEESLNQVGCIYTAQGLEFDYIALIWWNDLQWDEKNMGWRINLDASYDLQFIKSIVTFYKGKLVSDAPPWKVADGKQVKSIDAFLKDCGADIAAVRDLVFNTYRVLLTRAKKGVFLWFQDADTEKRFKKVILEESQ